ncbi:MAG: lactonase family protein, partial [Xanthomonadales bacterium]|nr:lactonase family protein [Xanthomonadales bacterium]
FTLGAMFLLLTAFSASVLASGYLYTANNFADGNGVHGYRVTDDGSLQELPGSPFATGGLGDGASPFSQNGVVVSQNQRLLFVVNQGSDDISAFHILRSGRLLPVHGSPFDSGGEFPVSLAFSGSVLYVSHLGPINLPFDDICEGCDLRGFRVRFNGSLRPIGGSRVSLETAPAGFPLAIQFNPAGDVLFGSRFVFSEAYEPGVPELFSYRLNHRTGLLTESPGSPFALREGSNQPIGFTFSPVNPDQLFVANSVSDTPTLQGTMSTYLMAASGQIAELDFSPVAANNEAGEAIATCWADFTSNGKNLYATNTTTDNVSRFTVDNAGKVQLEEIINVPPFDAVNDSPVDMLVTDDDQFLFVLQTLVGSVAGWRIQDDGTLVELPNQPVRLPEGSQPYGLVYVNRGF